MLNWLGIIVQTTWSALRTHRALVIENLALRQQLAVLKHRHPRPRLTDADRSPWQNPYVERVIGSIRRECLDHIVILGGRHLKRVLSSYVTYYHGARTHLSLVKDAPDGREVQTIVKGRVVELNQVGGLHHLYTRAAA